MDENSPGDQKPNETDQPISEATPAVELEDTAPHTKIDPPVHEKKPKKLLLIIVIFGVLLLIGGGVAAYLLMAGSEPQNSSNTSQKSQSYEEEKKADTELTKFLNPTTSEVWYDEQVEIENKGWLAAESAEYPPEVKYYEIGMRGDNKIVATEVMEIGSYTEFFEVTPDGKVTLIQNVSSTVVPREDIDAAMFSDDIAVDRNSHYDSLSIPTAGLELESGYSVIGPVSMEASPSYDASDGTTKTNELETPAGRVVRFETTYEEPGLKKTWFQYEINSDYAFNLTYKPLETVEETITWQSGDKTVNTNYSPIVRGCGIGTGVSIGFRLQDSDMKLVGTTASGQEVYELVSLDYKLLTKAVEEYNEFNSYIENFQPITKQIMVNKHGLIFYKDDIGNWLVYTRDDMAPQAGCAKPVVYLYPETITNVRVKVGADVKISDPLYSENGWDVIANPNGKLLVNGQSYGSLFWEGPGWGQYPGITTGKIVQTKEAITTVRSQLAALGLNQTEINDFVDYWQDKLPNKPYTRLTWLTTEQLDQLAPLFITPKPDTVIRVFLDYSGLDEPYQLPEQILTSIPRTGFTVVEWGGLSPYKLY